MKSLKGKVLVSLASVAILGGVTLGSVGAFADVSGSGAQTGVDVRFSGTIEPPGTAGNLQLNSVPAFVGFGTGAVNTPNAPFVAGNAITSHVGDLSDPYVKINDDRPTGGSESTEWKLQADASSLTEVSSGTEVISNGSININSSDANTLKEWTPGTAPNYTPGVVDDNSSYTTGVSKATTTTLPLGGGAQDIASTTTSARQGYAVKIDSMDLTVLSTNRSYAGKTFRGTITWTLTETV